MSLTLISRVWGLLMIRVFTLHLSSERITEVKKALSEKFDVKDLGELNYFLGVQVIQDHKDGKVWIGQPTFTESVLKKYGMEEAKLIKTPVNVNSKLVKASEESESADQGLYQSAYTSPQWAACSICPLEHDLILHLQSIVLLVSVQTQPKSIGQL